MDKKLFIIAGCNGAAEEQEQYYSNGKHFPVSMILRLYGIHA